MKKAATSEIKPWHIILFTIAILLVMWQLFGYIKEKRRMSQVTYDHGPGASAINPNTPPQLRSVLETMEREK